MQPFYFRDGHYIRTNDPSQISHRLDKFNFLLHNAVLEPPIAPVPLSRIGPLNGIRTTTDMVFAKRFRVFNFFKYNISSPFLESPKDPPENFTPSRKRKFSELEESEN
jgi:hypothetical protein